MQRPRRILKTWRRCYSWWKILLLQWIVKWMSMRRRKGWRRSTAVRTASPSHAWRTARCSPERICSAAASFSMKVLCSWRTLPGDWRVQILIDLISATVYRRKRSTFTTFICGWFFRFKKWNLFRLLSVLKILCAEIWSCAWSAFDWDYWELVVMCDCNVIFRFLREKLNKPLN